MSCNLLPLTHLRDFYDMVFLYNLIHGKYHIHFDVFFKYLVPTKQTRSYQNVLLLSIPRSRTNTFRDWYTIRCSRLWNTFPNYIRQIVPVPNVTGKMDVNFKKTLMEFLRILY